MKRNGSRKLGRVPVELTAVRVDILLKFSQKLPSGCYRVKLEAISMDP